MKDNSVPKQYPSQDQQGEIASKEGIGPGLFVSATSDLLAKPGANLDSWFLVGHFEVDGKNLDTLVHFLHVTPPADGPDLLAAMVSLIDPKTNKYLAQESDFPGKQCTFSSDTFNVVSPVASASGTAEGMTFKGKWSDAGIKISLTAKQSGPLLPNLGGGLFPCFGGSTYHYALSTMTASGTVTIGDAKYDVTGSAWLDRQWGVTPRFFGKDSKKWAWFGITMENGDRISVWEIAEAGCPVHSWATIVRPDGGVDVVACNPLTTSASRLWKSPKTGHVYPTSWSITIPQLHSHLDISPEVIEQEFVSPAGMHKYEGFSSVTGTLRGGHAKGRAIIELVGDWL